MNRALRLLLTLAVLWLGILAEPLVAQGIGPQLPGQEQSTGPDYEAWQRVAIRAERASEAGIVSTFALERMRAEIVEWRDRFLAAEGTNAARISTVRAQIEALGALPAEGATEDPVIAARRTELTDQLARLRAPVALATEAYAQANGLVSEIDRMVRLRQTERLTARGNSPLNPMSWPTGIAALWSAGSLLLTESMAGLKSDIASGSLAKNLPRPVVLFLIGLVLALRGGHWIDRVQRLLAARWPRVAPVSEFLLSLGRIVFPFLGIFLIALGFYLLEVFGFRGQTVLNGIVDAAGFVIVGRWLSRQFFGAEPGPLRLADGERRTGRRIVAGLAWTLALGSVLIELVQTGDQGGTMASVVLFPIEIVVGLFLYRLGRLLSRAGQREGAQYRDRLVAILGRVIMVVAVAGPVLAALGYATAAEALLYPSVMTLATLAVVMLLQKFAFDVYGFITRRENADKEALLPLLVGIALLLLAVPVIALIWGAKEADLLEVWTRFKEGFLVGETRISPTDFVTFAMIFAVGYMLTRLVQGTLRTTVLPKTRLDIGGQNAIVSGLGYIGIFLAALIAITATGIDLSSLAIVAGALSVGIGFGLQNIVSNFVSGIILLIERPISEGDWIEVGGQMGYVRDISVRSTRIETFDRTDVIIPNADLVSGQVTNWTRGNSVGRVIVPVGVAYGSDTEKVTKILREIAEAHPMVLLQPPPNVVFVAFGADSLNFEIRAIVRDVNFGLNTKSEMNHEINRRFAEAGIGIPFPQRDLWIRNPEALREPPKPRKPPKDEGLA